MSCPHQLRPDTSPRTTGVAWGCPLNSSMQKHMVVSASVFLDLQRTLPGLTPKAFTCAQGGAVSTRATLLVPPRTRPASVRGRRMAAHPASKRPPQACITGRPWPPKAPSSIRCTKETESSVLGNPGGLRSSRSEHIFRVSGTGAQASWAHHTWACSRIRAGLPLMLHSHLPCLLRAWSTPMLGSRADAGPRAGPCLAPAGLGARCPLRPWAPASRHCEG